ncbi:MAG TPA: sulfur carrier protein ThiS [Kiloniellaceae bacterium]
MRIVLNGKSREVAVARLDRVLEELGFHGTKVATAVNGQFVARSRRGETALGEGDRVEVIAPMQGG